MDEPKQDRQAQIRPTDNERCRQAPSDVADFMQVGLRMCPVEVDLLDWLGTSADWDAVYSVC
jgi:hypothetical protein